MLEQEVRDIREKLRERHYASEADVRQAIVEHLLIKLGWPSDNSQVFRPEYPLRERRRVDFALCHPANEPRIFIEVKQVGNSDGAERQLFEYASYFEDTFHRSVQLAVLTDGRVWSFFIPSEEGDENSYEEQLVYRMDLFNQDIAESVWRFERYLRYEAVCSEEALIAARNDYQDVVRERQVHDDLRQAWAKLVKENDKSLLSLVSDCVDDLFGYRPTLDTIARFLKTVQPGLGPMPPSAVFPTPPDPPPTAEDPRPAEVTLPQPLDLGSASVGLPRPLMQPSQDAGPGLSSE